MTQPIPTSLVANDDPPSHYLIEICSRYCLHCRTVHEWSDPYSVHPIRNGQHKRPIKHMDEVKYNLPVRTQRLNPYMVPFCHDCSKEDMFSHLPKAPPPKTPTNPSWVGANSPRDYTIAGTIKKKEPKATSAAKPRTYTLDDVD